MKTFKELELIAPLQRAVDDANYKHPTEIQSQTIPDALQGIDILGCAQTGTGKTAAFVLPILDYLGSEPVRAASGKPFSLILAPTRELAIQIGESIETYGKYLKIRTALVYGGVNQASQVHSLQRGAEIVVATPGRLLDLMQQGHISLENLEIFVLDEADRMLDMGFLPDLKRIIRSLPNNRQSLFFSATLSPKIIELAKGLLFQPSIVNVTPASRSVDKIQQQLLLVDRGEKPKRLHDALKDPSVRLAIVFTRTKRSANTVERKLQQQGIHAAAIHGNKSQSSRQRTLEAFRGGKLKVLVATDVAARGIDVNDVSHVINYDLPSTPESYVHRIGRTGRAGAAGIAITFYTSEEHADVRAIERYTGTQLCDPSIADAAGPVSKTSRSSGDSGKPRSQARRPQSRRKQSQKPQNATATARVSPQASTTGTSNKKVTRRNSGQQRKQKSLMPA